MLGSKNTQPSRKGYVGSSLGVTISQVRLEAKETANRHLRPSGAFKDYQHRFSSASGQVTDRRKGV